MKYTFTFVLLQNILFHPCIASSKNRSNGILISSDEFINALSSTDGKYVHVFESPQCWIGSFQEILRGNFGSSYDQSNSHNMLSNVPGSSICAALSSDERTVLALELTRCFFAESYLNFSPKCHSTMTEKEDIKTCIQSLNDTEFHSYNEFYTQIYTICTQLSQENWNSKLAESAYLLFESSRELSGSLDQIILDHRSEWDKLNLKYQSEQESYLNLMNQKLEMSSSEIDRLGQISQKISASVTYGKENITYIRPLLFLLAQLNIAWLMTSMHRSRRGRPIIICIMISGFFFEIGINYIQEILSITIPIITIKSIRKWILMLEIAVFTLSIIFTKKDDANKPVSMKDVDNVHDKIMQKLNESHEKYHTDMILMEERIVQLIHDTTRMRNSMHPCPPVYTAPSQPFYYPITPIYQNRQDESLIPEQRMHQVTRKQKNKRKQAVTSKNLEEDYDLGSASLINDCIPSISSFKSPRTENEDLSSDFFEDIEDTPKSYNSEEDEMSIVMDHKKEIKMKKRGRETFERNDDMSLPEKRQRIGE